MKKLSWQKLMEVLKAEKAGGDYIATVDGKRQSIGKRVGGEVLLSALGEKLSYKLCPAQTAEKPPAAASLNDSTTPAPRRRGGRPRKVVVPVTEDTDNA